LVIAYVLYFTKIVLDDPIR